MKKVLSCIIAVVMLIVTCLGINHYCDSAIEGKNKELIYYNTDNRNSCKEAMEAIFECNAIPVFGSSELSAADDIAYPPVLFHNGNSDFNMILIGRGSMQSLHHTINLGAMADVIPNRKVVLILSPQWFTASHLSSEAYASRFSERMYAEFIKNPQISKETKRKVSDRVEALLVSDPKELEQVKQYETVYLERSLNPVYHVQLKIYDSFMTLKQKFTLLDAEKDRQAADWDSANIDEIDFDVLMQEAVKAGEKACTNNEYYIYDEYYDTYVRAVLEERKDSQVDSSYLVSPEYDDFRLFLDVCKETGIEPLVVSIPVNGYWYDWIGFSKEERQAYYQKIRGICDEYGVQMADFSDKEYEPYFLKDIMHLGWKGWVYLDEAVYKFYQ